MGCQHHVYLVDSVCMCDILVADSPSSHKGQHELCIGELSFPSAAQIIVDLVECVGDYRWSHCVIRVRLSKA